MWKPTNSRAQLWSVSQCCRAQALDVGQPWLDQQLQMPVCTSWRGTGWLLIFCILLAAAYVDCQADEANSIAPVDGQSSHNTPRLLQTVDSWYPPTEDDPQQLLSLAALYNSTSGASWAINSKALPRVHPWFSPGVSYCRWFGVSCCLTSPLAATVNCSRNSSIAILDLQAFGLHGSLPPASPPLPDLVVLNLADNLGLTGVLPDAWLPRNLLWLSVKGTNLGGCIGHEAHTPDQMPSSDCQLPPNLELVAAESSNSPAAPEEAVCPTVRLRSFTQRTQGLPQEHLAWLTLPYSQAVFPGAVQADPVFTDAHQCTCTDSGMLISVDAHGQLRCKPHRGGESNNKHKWILIVTLVAIVPHVLLGLGVFIFLKHKAYLHRLIRFKEDMMQTKRTKVPGTPGFMLKGGQGMVPIADTMVTWVWTDVSSSTLLWEWNATVMDVAIDQHNRALRELLDEFGGHEIRNEGDGFVLSFHDALDGVNFCIKAQEQLHELKWPAELLTHQDAAVVTVGDLLHDPATANLGPSVIAGLRVRMAVNTGMPEDIFLHDLTEQIDYRGPEYDLTAELCDLASGGQILIGPKTYQSWSRSHSDLGQEAWANLLAEAAKTDLQGASHTTMVDRVMSLTLSGRQPWAMRSSSSRSSFKGPRRVDSLAWMGRPSQAAGQLSSLSRRLSVCVPGEPPNWAAGLGSMSSGLGLSPGHQPSWQAQRSSCSHLPGNPRTNSIQRSNLSSIPQSTSNLNLAAAAAALQEPTLSPRMESDLQPLGSALLQDGHALSSCTQPGMKARRHSLPLLTLPQPPPTNDPAAYLKTMLTGASDSIHGHESAAGTIDDPDSVPPTQVQLNTGQGVDSDHGRQGTGGYALRAYHPVGCLQHLKDRMLSRCLACLRLATSTEDSEMLGADEEDGQRGNKVSQRANTARGTVIDLGYYRMTQVVQTMRSIPAEMHPGEHNVIEQVVHLVQVLPSSLLARALLFPWPTKLPPHWEKISPGFFDAPGSSSFMPPGMREVMALGHVPANRPTVVMVFSSIDGIKDVAAYNVRLAQESTSMHNACVRETLSVCNGYECKEFEGSFMLAFDKASTAMEWAITVQLALLHVPWHNELLLCNHLTEEVRDAGTQQLVYRGLRARVGIYSGTIDRISVARTGRADMFGQPVNRAARLMSAAHGGMCICDINLKNQVLEEWTTKFSHWDDPGVQGDLKTLDAGQKDFALGTDSKDGMQAAGNAYQAPGPAKPMSRSPGGSWKAHNSPYDLNFMSSPCDSRASPGAPREFKLSRSFGSSLTRSQTSGSHNAIALGIPPGALQPSPTLRTYASIHCGSIPAKEEPVIEPASVQVAEPHPLPVQQTSRSSLHSPDILSTGHHTLSHGSVTPSSAYSPPGTHGGAPPALHNVMQDVPYLLQSTTATTSPMAIRGGRPSRLNSSMSNTVDIESEHVEIKPQVWDPTKWSRASTRRLSATSGKSGSACAPPAAATLSTSPSRMRVPLDKMASGPLQAPSPCHSVSSLPVSSPRRQSWQVPCQVQGSSSQFDPAAWDGNPGSSPANSSTRAPTRGSSMPFLSNLQGGALETSCVPVHPVHRDGDNSISLALPVDPTAAVSRSVLGSPSQMHADPASHEAGAGALHFISHGQHSGQPWHFLGPDPNSYGHGSSISPMNYIYHVPPGLGRHHQGASSDWESHQTTSTSHVSRRAEELHEPTSMEPSNSTASRPTDYMFPASAMAVGRLADSSSRSRVQDMFLSPPPHHHHFPRQPHPRKGTLDDPTTSGTDGMDTHSASTRHVRFQNQPMMTMSSHTTATSFSDVARLTAENSKRTDVARMSAQISTCNSATSNITGDTKQNTGHLPNLPGRTTEKSQGGASAVCRAFPRGLSTNGGDILQSTDNNNVVAECYRIARSPQSEAGAASPGHPATDKPHSPGITLIRYRAKTEISMTREDEMAPIDEAEALKPSAMSTVIPLVPLDVTVWALGSYQLKGVAELVKIMQILPVALERRLEQVHEGTLNKAKARCVKPSMTRQERVTIFLPDVTKMSCCMPINDPEVVSNSLTFPDLGAKPGFLSVGSGVVTTSPWDTLKSFQVTSGDEMMGPQSSTQFRDLHTHPKMEVARPTGLVVPSPNSLPSQGPTATPAAPPTTYSSYSASLPSATRHWEAGALDTAGEHKELGVDVRKAAALSPRYLDHSLAGGNVEPCKLGVSQVTPSRSEGDTPRLVGALSRSQLYGAPADAYERSSCFPLGRQTGEGSGTSHETSQRVSVTSIFVHPEGLPANLYNSVPGGVGSGSAGGMKPSGSDRDKTQPSPAVPWPSVSKVAELAGSSNEGPWQQTGSQSAMTRSGTDSLMANMQHQATTDWEDGLVITAEDVAQAQHAANVLLRGVTGASQDARGQEQGDPHAARNQMVQQWAQHAADSSSGGLVFDLDVSLSHGMVALAGGAQPAGEKRQWIQQDPGSAVPAVQDPGNPGQSGPADHTGNPAVHRSSDPNSLLQLPASASGHSSAKFGLNSSRLLPSLRYGVALGGSGLEGLDTETAHNSASLTPPGTSDTVTFSLP